MFEIGCGDIIVLEDLYLWIVLVEYFDCGVDIVYCVCVVVEVV